MNVSLTPHLEALVEQKVKSGRYSSASEVVREALRLLDERDQLQSIRLSQLRQEVQKGLDQIDACQGTTHDAVQLSELSDAIKDRGRRRVK